MNNIFQKIKDFFYGMTNPTCNISNQEKFKNLKFPIHIIYFYKNECPHCKNFSSEIEKLNDENFFTNKKIELYKININENGVFDSKFNISEEKLTDLKKKVNGVPAIFFLDDEENILDMSIEGNDIEKFKKNYANLDKASKQE